MNESGFEQVKLLGTYKTSAYRGKGERLINAFLNKLVQEFADHNVRFFQLLGEWPFEHRERQVNSSLFPAIHEISEACFLEQPIGDNRKWGWVDYWILYEGKTIYLELKHAKESARSLEPSDKCVYRWIRMKEQVKRMKKAQLLSIYESFPIFKLGMMIVPFHGRDTYFEDRRLNDLIERYTSVLGSNWWSFWKINPSVYEDSNDSKTWKGVLLLGYVKVA